VHERQLERAARRRTRRLGVTIFPADLIPTGLAEMPDGHGLPDLGTVEFVLLGAGRTLSGPAAELADAILASGIRV